MITLGNSGVYPSHDFEHSRNVAESLYYNQFAKLDTRDAIDVLCMGLKPARAAKIRLAAIVKKDRAACGDGRWVYSTFSDFFLECMQLRNPVDPPVKPHFRWEPRR